MSNFIYGTWSVLCAFNAAGIDLESSSVRRAVEWLLSVQNSDGGWGEGDAGYDLVDKTYKPAPSTASQTAWAVIGLMAAGEVDGSAVERGIAFLRRTQGEDGFWPEELFTGTGFPRVFYLRYHGYPKFFPSGLGPLPQPEERQRPHRHGRDVNLGRRVIAVSGLVAETRIAEAPGVVVLAGGGHGARLAALIEDNIRAGAGALISFGIAGGLEPGLKPGTIVIGRAIHDGAARYAADPDWVANLARDLPHARSAEIAGVDEAVCDIRSKADLRGRTGAAAVDMESHIVGRLATRHHLPFAALRVVSDPAGRGLPAAALAGMGPDGATKIGAVLLSLGREPRQLPDLIRTALDARAAFRGLKASRQSLSPSFSFDGPEGPDTEAMVHG